MPYTSYHSKYNPPVISETEKEVALSAVTSTMLPEIEVSYGQQPSVDMPIADSTR